MAQPTAQTLAPAGEHKTSFPPFDASSFPSQLVSLAVVFAVLYVVVARFIAPRVQGILDARALRLSENIQAAAEAQKQSQAAMSAYEEAVTSARQKAFALAEESKAKAQKKSDKKRAELEAELAQKINEAETRIAAQKATALKSVRSISEEVATTIVDHFTGKPATAAELAAAFSGKKIVEAA